MEPVGMLVQRKPVSEAAPLPFAYAVDAGGHATGDRVRASLTLTLGHTDDAHGLRLTNWALWMGQCSFCG